MARLTAKGYLSRAIREGMRMLVVETYIVFLSIAWAVIATISYFTIKGDSIAAKILIFPATSGFANLAVESRSESTIGVLMQWISFPLIYVISTLFISFIILFITYKGVTVLLRTYFSGTRFHVNLKRFKRKRKR